MFKLQVFRFSGFQVFRLSSFQAFGISGIDAGCHVFGVSLFTICVCLNAGFHFVMILALLQKSILFFMCFVWVLGRVGCACPSLFWRESLRWRLQSVAAAYRISRCSPPASLLIQLHLFLVVLPVACGLVC